VNDTVQRLLASNRDHAAADGSRFDDLQEGQSPDAVSVCCSDSRVLHEHLWGIDEPGRVFAVGNIGNRVCQHTADGERVVAGDVLYPLRYTGTDTAVVVGHTGCGAVTATYDALTDGGDDGGDEPTPAGVAACIDLLTPGLRSAVEALPEDVDRAVAIDRLVEANVDRQIEALRESDEVPDDTALVGVVYDFQDVYGGRRGEVHVVNVDGERDVQTLRAAHPDAADRIDRLSVLA